MRKTILVNISKAIKGDEVTNDPTTADSNSQYMTLVNQSDEESKRRSSLSNIICLILLFKTHLKMLISILP